MSLSSLELPRADVVVVGLGPVGTVLTGLLGRRGISVVAFERATDVFALPRAAHIDHTGIRTIQELGCVDLLLKDMIANAGIDFVTADGKLLGRISGNQGSESDHPASMYFHQPQFDRQLREAVAAQAKVSMFLGANVDSVSDKGDSVVVRAGGEADFVVEASYVVACDGASSSVREMAEIELEDLGFDEPWLVVDLLLDQEAPELPKRAVVYCDPKRPVTLIPMPNNRFRCELMVLADDDVLGAELGDAVLANVARWVPPHAARMERQAVYTFHGLVARPWQRGRVLLAGDAAHQMPPFLGQGMNSGLRDAANLAWKLDLVLSGLAPAKLLDTYEQERRPHVRSIVDTSVRIGRFVCTLDVEEASRRDEQVLNGSRSFKADLNFFVPPLERGPLIIAGGGRLFPQAVGSGEGPRFDDVIGGRFLLVVRDGIDRTDDEDWWSDYLGALVIRPSDMPRFGTSLASALDVIGADVVAVRPDRYVLGTGSDVHSITEEVRAYFSC
jgi:3-(3-hydroxy-phenyl)propionate hydroxylase